MKGTRGWLLFIAVAVGAVVGWFGAAVCEGNPFDSVCEVSFPKGTGNVVGSGVCVRSDDEVWTLTNAHVIRNHRGKIYTQWVYRGVPSKKLTATEVWRLDGEKQDLAILRQSAEPFSGRVPTAAKLLPAGTVLPKGSILYTIGCPGGANPTLLECRLVEYQTYRAGMKLLPRVESGRSGGPVFSEDGQFLVGIVDAWDKDEPSKYGAALYASQIRATLSKMIPEPDKPRLFDGSLLQRCQSGQCGIGGKQQQAVPPGKEEAYPDLPPLAGVGDTPPMLPAQVVDETARTQVMALTAEMTALKADLAGKEIRLQALFGGDYQLLKDIAADAKAAQATAEDVKEAVKDATAVAAAARLIANGASERDYKSDKEKTGLIAGLKTRIDGLEGEDGEGGKFSKIKGLIGLATSPFGLIKKLGWPLGFIAAAIVLVWMRVEYKLKTGKQLVTGKVAKAAVGAVGHVAGRAGDAVEAVGDRLEAAAGRVIGKIRDRRARRKEATEDAEVLAEMAEMAKENAT